MMKKNILHKCATLLAICLYTVIFSSCEGMFEGIYDDAEPKDNGKGKDNIFGFTSYDSVTHKGIIYLNLTDYKQWTYLSFKDRTFEQMPLTGSLTGDWDGQSAIVYQYIHGNEFIFDTLIQTDTQKEPQDWDLALHRYEARTSNGAYQTQYTSLNDLPADRNSLGQITFSSDEISDNLVMTDISSMMNYRIGYQKIKCSSVLSSWLNMDISSPPPVYTPSNRVYLVRFSDNSVAALHLDNYISNNGTKGYLTISFIYPY